MTDATFAAVLADLLGGLAPEAEAWIDAAVARGPVPPEGPLRHDVLLPGASVGLNVFGFDAALKRTAIDWAARFLGGEAAGATEKLFASGADFSGGFATGPLRLKLYASGPKAAALAPDEPFRIHAVGLDVGADGVGRVRTYHLPGPGLLDGFRVPDAWEAFGGRRLVTVLRAGDRQRRTLNFLFQPGDGIDRLLAMGVPDPERVLAAHERLRPAGLVLRPVALEIDVWSDGVTGTDALVAVGQPQKRTS